MIAKPFFSIAWGQSDPGQKRPTNEDSYLIAKDLNLYVVADGMGGHAGGETASKLAIQTLESIVRENEDTLLKSKAMTEHPEHDQAAQLLSDALRGACHEVHQLGERVFSLQGMGTTTTALLLHHDSAYIAHVGDSRAYLMRDHKLMQLSEDHSLVNEQIKAGILTPSQAQSSKLRNIITRSIGFEDDVDVDVVTLKLLPNDVFIICSDGLTTMVKDCEIEKLFKKESLASVPQACIDLANARGGDDNITVVTIYISDKDLSGKNNLRLK